MKKINLSTSKSFRNPSQTETAKVSEWIYQYSSSNIKIGKIMSIILTVIGIVFIISAVSGTTGDRIAFYILGCSCFALTYLFVRTRKNHIDINQGYKNGEFIICDGVVSKTETNMDSPGCINIWFQSKDQQFNDGWYRVRQENIEIGSPLILTIPNSERTKRFSPIAFTNFMLTDEGIALHW